MVQKECNCKTCSGVLPELDQDDTIEKTEKEILSIYDRLRKLTILVEHDTYTNKKTVVELDRIMELIDSLDNDILAIQKEALINPKEYTQFLLGKLSQKLY